MNRQTAPLSARLYAGRHPQQGFTLIELMIVVAIIAVLSVIAIASYDWAVTKTRRKEAAGCLEQSAQFMERYYSNKLTYVGAALPANTCPTDIASFYTVALTAPATATAYSLSATPLGVQHDRDTTCGTLGLDQKGTKTPTTDGCW